MSAQSWERVVEQDASTLDRIRVEGGWLYRARDWQPDCVSTALQFVPDTSPKRTPKQ